MLKVNEKGSGYSESILRDVAEKVIQGMHILSSCQSVALRLRRGDDYTYLAYLGFPEFFIRKENQLGLKDSVGQPVWNGSGVPFLECMCGNVLRGHTDPRISFFTKRGSFWTNSTSKLLAGITEEERSFIGRTRDMCHNSGYESVALIPMHANGGMLGLVQLNDPRENMFSLDRIENYELLADQAGAAILDALGVLEKMSRFNELLDKTKNEGK